MYVHHLNSKYWIIVKRIPKNTVVIKDSIASFLLPPLTLWWDTVTQHPDHNKITVFSSGKPHGLMASIPAGGHWTPISGAGDSPACKYAQKKELKNIASETTNRKNPNFKVYTILNVCAPW